MQELKKKFGRNCHYKTAASKLQNHLLWNSCPQWFKKFHLRQFHPRIFKWDIFGDFQPVCTGKDISFSLNKLGTKVSISNIGCRASGRDSSRHPGRKPFFFVKTTRIYYLVDNAPNLNFHLRAEFSIVGLTRIIRGMSVKVKMEGWPQRPLRPKKVQIYSRSKTGICDICESRC